MNVLLRIRLIYRRKDATGDHKQINLDGKLEIPDKNLMVARKLRLCLPDKEPRHFFELFIPLTDLYTRVRSGDEWDDSWFENTVELEHVMHFSSYQQGLRMHQALLSDGRFKGTHSVWARPHRWTKDPNTWNGPNIKSVSRLTPSNLDAVLLQDIADLNVRAKNAFLAAGIRTIGQLRLKSREELLKLKSFGKVPLRLAQITLRSIGVDVNWD